MDIKRYHHDISLEEVSEKSDTELLQYVYTVQKKTGASTRDVFISLYEHLGKMVVNDMVRDRDHSLNNDAKYFPESSVLWEIATATFIAFVLLNVILTIVFPSETFSWNTLAAYTVASSIVSWLLVSHAGKHDRKYYKAIHKVQQVQV